MVFCFDAIVSSMPIRDPPIFYPPRTPKSTNSPQSHSFETIPCFPNDFVTDCFPQEEKKSPLHPTGTNEEKDKKINQ